VRDIAISPDGRWLASAGADHSILLWDLHADRPDERALRLAGHKERVNTVVFSPDGQWLVSGGADGLVARWSLPRGDASISLRELWGSSDRILRVAVSPDGRSIVAGTWGPYALAWTADDEFTQPVRLAGHTSSVGSIAVSPDGQWVVTASARDNFALLFRLEGIATRPDRQPLHLRGEDHWVNCAGFSPDGTIVVAGNGGALRVWQGLPEEPKVHRIHGVDLNHHAVSAGADWLVAAGASMAMGGEPIDGRAKRVRLDPARVEVSAIEASPGVQSVAVSADGGRLVLGGRDDAVIVVDAATNGLRRFDLPGAGWVRSVAVSRDGRWAAACDGEDRVRLWDLAEPAPAATILSGPDGRAVESVAFAAGDRHLLTVERGGWVSLWQCAGAASVRLWSVDHRGDVVTAALAPDATWLASGHRDGAVGLTRLAEGSVRDTSVLTSHDGWVTDAVFSHDGRWLCTTSRDHTARVWDLAAQGPVVPAAILRGHRNEVHGAAFAPDSRRLVTASMDHTARLWVLADDRWVEAGVLQHDGPVTLAAFQPETRRLVTGGLDQAVRFWDMDVPRMLDSAARVAGRNFSAEEWQRFFGGQPYARTFSHLP
jgi:WD40 repeat protein